MSRPAAAGTAKPLGHSAQNDGQAQLRRSEVEGRPHPYPGRAGPRLLGKSLAPLDAFNAVRGKFHPRLTPRFHCRLEVAPGVCFQGVLAISIHIHCRLEMFLGAVEMAIRSPRVQPKRDPARLKALGMTACYPRFHCRVEMAPIVCFQ